MSKRTKFLLGIGVIAALVMGWQIAAFAGPVGNAQGFEDDDGNLVVNSTFDWNGFAPTTWTGTAPNRTSTKTAGGFSFTGIEDAQATTSDNGFAGGTKQDNNCATVTGSKAPNKDDLKRIYLATKNVGGNVYLDLAWVRIPQNTTSSSAHVGFEFNKGTTACGAGSGGLVQRTAGDILIVYDFEGGSSTPVLTLRKWVTSGACEVSSNSAPCWGTATNLTTGGFAEGAVNTGPVLDTIGPAGNETLGTAEFGEAGINLTGAGVFTPGQCETFGKASAVSRSSGSSGTAQMKDLVGPANFTLSNCATVITRKVTAPSPDPNDHSFGFTTNVTTSPATTTSPFSLKNGESKTITNVITGSGKLVTEDDPSPDYSLTSIDCSASTVPAANRTTNTTTRQVSFSIAAGETLDCTFTNTLNAVASSMTSVQEFIPNDTATVSAPSGGNLNGSVKFELFESNDCGVAGSDAAIYTQDVDVDGASPVDVSTTNTTVSTDEANVSWRLTYTSDNPLQESIPATCLEKTALTIDNGGTATST